MDVCTTPSGNLVRASPPREQGKGGGVAKNKNANPTQTTAEHLFRMIYDASADPGFNFYSGARANYYNGSNVPTKGFYGAEGMVNISRPKTGGGEGGGVKTQRQQIQEMGLPVQFGSAQKGRKQKQQMTYADNPTVKKIAADAVASVAVPIQKKRRVAAAPIRGAIRKGTSGGGAPTNLVSWFLS